VRITRLKLSGFKSFVEPADLVIAPGLTGVVGPNGCGKSNLLEAIRWVMGEGSPKTLRGGAMDDVIFAGTARRPRRDFAEVTLFAEGVAAQASRMADAEDGEVEVARRIERGAGSAYRLNGRDVRAKDVALLFADAATGAHSPALVSQGRIAAVIAARPAERRAMLEEAAGIAGLHVRRKDAEQKLRATEANLARLGEITADMELRAQALRRQARAAERYRTLSDRIALAEARAMFARYRICLAEEKQAADALAQSEDSARTAQEAQLGAAAAARAATDALAAERSAVQKARDAVTAARHRLDKLTAERQGVERRIADFTAQLQRLDQDEARETALDRDAAAASERLSAEAEDLAERIAALDATMPALATRIAGHEASARDAEVALAQAMARQASEQAERRVAEAALAAARQRLDRAAAERQAIDSARAALPDMAPIAERLAAAEAARDAAATRTEAADAAISAAETARARQAEAQSARQGALAAARATLAALDAEAAALAKDSLPAQGSSRALDQIRAAPGYERALAAALGDELSAPIAAEGKLRWAGAAVDPLDPPVPDGLTCLAAHVDAPPALARTLALVLVADADDGRPLRAGQRLVTRDGRLRRWDGYIVEEGGAAAAARLIRLNRLDAIKAERPALAEAVESHAQALQEAETALRQAEADGRAARQQLSEARDALRAAERTIDEQRALAERLDQRRADLDRRAEEQAVELAAAETAQQEAADVMAALPDGSGTQGEIARLNSACETARRGVADLRAELALAERGIAGQRDRLKTVEAERASWAGRAADALARLADMAARRTTLGEEIAALQPRPALLDEQIRASGAETGRLDADAAAAAASETAASTALRAAEDALAAANEGLTRAREHRASLAARAEHATQRRLEVNGQCGERFQCPPPLLPERFGFAPEDSGHAHQEQEALDRLLSERERMGPVNLVAAQELAEIEAEQARSAAESEELSQAVNRLRGSVGALNREGRQRLLAAFEAVNGHFQRLFSTLFNGGQAHLALVDSDDPLEAGLEIMAQPPGKKLATLTLLSGGEQALTAVALIFGLFLTNPAPICVLDEVDAPLDDANVERFCDLLDRMVQQTATRYLIVTHNAVTMSRMHRLYGVTMVEQGISRLVSVDLHAAERLLTDAV
jgi:chromosome segregation protein